MNSFFLNESQKLNYSGEEVKEAYLNNLNKSDNFLIPRGGKKRNLRGKSNLTIFRV